MSNTCGLNAAERYRARSPGSKKTAVAAGKGNRLRLSAITRRAIVGRQQYLLNNQRVCGAGSAKPMKPLRLVIFDCDGTLVDSQWTIIGAMHKAFAGLHLPRPSEDAIRRVVGLSLHETMTRLWPDGTDVEYEGLIEGYRSAFFEMRSAPDYEEPLFPGVDAVLDHIEAVGMLAGVATGKSLRGLEATLARHGIQDRFVTLQTADQNPGKPHPAMVQRAIAEAGGRVQGNRCRGRYDLRCRDGPRCGHLRGRRVMGLPPCRRIACRGRARRDRSL